jgi:hypothetical protein
MVKDKNIVYGVEYVMRFLGSILDLGRLTDRMSLYSTVKGLLEQGKYDEVAVDTITAQTRRLLGIKARRL